jgi:hypothetical protein
MQSLTTLKMGLQKDMEKLQASGDFCDKPASLKDYQSYLKVLCTVLHEIALPEEKSALVKALVHRIEVFPDRVKVKFLVGEIPIQRELDYFAKQDEEKKLKEVTRNKGINVRNPGAKFFLVRGSKREL